MPKYTYVVWDWNGTLLNDIAASLASVNDMLDMRGMRHIDIDFYKECICTPIKGFYDRVFDMENEDYSLIIKQYNDGYLRHLESCDLTSGAVDALEHFRACGTKQIIVSSSNNEQLLMNADKYNVTQYFDSILGAGDYFAASKIERAADYLKKNNPKNGRVLVVGDLAHDAEMAKKLGADCVLLSSGHEHFTRLNDAKVPLIEDLSALKTI